MGRPEPYVVFAQTFVHPQLDEYVDEVLFAEPIVITACEFLEQSASLASTAVTLLGATSPPSFALEVFVQCEGEARFRRLCQPFLYSHLSSNMLEVEAVVTNHLVVRGSYRSLSLIVYGNTAEDLGQFNIEFDLDSSLANLVSTSEAKLEDLPPLLHSRNSKFEDSISTLKALPSVLPDTDISIQIRQFLQLVFKILDLPDFGDLGQEFMATVTSAAASFFINDLASSGITLHQLNLGRLANGEKPLRIFIEAKRSLLDLCRKYVGEGYIHGDFLEECGFLEPEADLATSKELTDLFFLHFQCNKNIPFAGHPYLSQSNNVLLWLSLALLLCSGKESCFHYMNGGGMEHLVFLLGKEIQNSATVTLMLLGVVEQATRYSVGCEGVLGWWPREDETVPSGISEGYSQLLKLLMQKQRHDIAALATYVLHRLRFYEVAARYECVVLSMLGGLSGARNATTATSGMLFNAKLQLKKLLKLMNSSGWIQDPSPVGCATRSFMVGAAEGLLSYKTTHKLISSSSCRFLQQEIDAKLLSLLKERGFLPLSVALISSSGLRAEVGHALEAFVDLTSSIEAAVIRLMFCRTGLVFLLQHPDLSSTMIDAFRGTDDVNECVPLRYASVLISKGFFCRLLDVGINLEMHLRVVNAVDRLLTSTPQSEEFLWVLWELCSLSRSEYGRQAVLALGLFPEAVRSLIEALHSAKELEPVSFTCGTPLNLAIFHASAEIFELIVTDPTSSSLSAWIVHATDLHKALHSSSPGSNRKDAPTRLLEWIDAGVVYQKNGAIGLLRYAAVLASGGDAHITSTNTLVSESMDVENVVGDSSTESDVNVVESLLGKLVSEKSFDGVALRDSSVAQLTTAIRILAFLSENSDIAASLYDEGALTVVYVILVNCRLMLERSSNNYDYLVDDGIECSSTSDLLLERNREKYLVDLLIPSLLLLLELLQRLKEAKEQHRNTKLMSVLLKLHRELSPKLAACAVDVSSSYPDTALSLETVCHLIASALASWPTHAWAPGLFHTLLDSVQAASSLALGPKETCSMLCLLNDLLPEEGSWHWKNGMPVLSAVQSLAVGSLLGPVMERKVNWYLEPPHVEVLLSQLSQHLDNIAQVVFLYAVSTLVVVQDMLRIFVLRLARQRAENAAILLHPIISWIQDRLIESSSLADTDAYKAYKLLDFISCVLEHPLAKPLLLKEGAVLMLTKVLERIDTYGKSASDASSSIKSGFNISSCYLPVLRSLSLICDSRYTVQLPAMYSRYENLKTEDFSMIYKYVFKLCQVLPAGKELLACLSVFKELASQAEGQRALLEAFLYIKCSNTDENQRGRLKDTSVYNSNLIDTEWRSALLYSWMNLYRSIEKEGLSMHSIEAVGVLSLGSLRFCMDGKSYNKDRIVALKYFFGLLCDPDGTNGVDEENMKYVRDMSALLTSKITDDEYVTTSHLKATLHQVAETAQSLSLVLLKPIDLLNIDDVMSNGVLMFLSDVSLSSKIHLLTDSSSERVENERNVVDLSDKFQWECSENLRNRLSQAGLLVKRKMSAVDGANRHGKGETAAADVRGAGLSATPPIATRRDTFRQRKPNTSRPPSMHVDDYVARERNADGSANPNVIAIPRLGSGGGRPPSIHVDEFMARQRERQNAVTMAGVEAASQAKKVPLDKENDATASNKSKQLKVDLDDDLQGIDIVFDAEDNEPDDKLPFPPADDNLNQSASASAAAEQSPRHSIVEETESDAKDLETTAASNVNENTQSELSSRMSVSCPDMQLRREPSVSSGKFFEQPDDMKNVNVVTISGGFDSPAGAKTSGLSPSIYGKGSPSMSQLPDSRMLPPSYIPDNNMQRLGNAPFGGSQGHHEQKHLPSPPPLPPTPPPPTISPVRSQASEANPVPSAAFPNSRSDVQPPLHPTYHVQADYQSSYGNIPTSSASANVMGYSRASHSSPGGPTRPLPPLPPTPPPFSAMPLSVPSRSPSQPSVYGQNSAGVSDISQYAPPPMMPSNFSRPASMPFPVQGNLPVQQSDILSSMSQNAHAFQTSMQSLQPLTHLQPLQPPQLPCPQLPHQLRAQIQADQGGPSHSHLQMQLQAQPQMLQQSQISQYNMCYQAQQQENLQHPQQHMQTLHQPAESATQQQMDSSMSLQQYFSSPEAIQSLLSDRDKLCQLLEQHPKLMQMLQERLGQL